MKIYKSTLILLFFSTMLVAQSLSGVKVCIDPGHGGHDAANDRHIIIPDFWESEGNYSKALHAEEILSSLGATVIVTRQGNTDSDDLALSVRAGIANTNNVDLFQSIHSNATGTSTRRNSTLILFRGYDSSPVFPEAKTYAGKVYRNIEAVNHVTDLSTDNIRGDWSFYPSWGTSGLGVLRPLTMPGVLSEGSFHDYIPEAFRLKNNEYLRHEAWAITRSMLDYFSAGSMTTGNLAGILRDPFESVPSTYQPISALGDTKKPVNIVSATLQPGNLVYTGDDQNNGYYYFENLTPGQYKLYYSAENYAMDSVDVTVYANKSTFVDKNLTLVPNENNPNVVATVPVNQATNFSNAANIEIEFDINMEPSTTEAAFSITPAVTGTFEWEDNQKKLIFNPTGNLVAGTDYQVKIANTAKTIFDKQLAFGYNFSFSTRSKLNLLSSYPLNGATDISRSVEVRLTFDQAIDATSLPGNISFEDSDGNFVNLAVDYYAYSKGIISFVPTSKLVSGAIYKVILGENLGDIEGVTFQENIINEFTVETESYIDGTLVDDFETAGNWNSPLSNTASVGLDNSSSFEISYTKKYNGNSAGKVNYSFRDSVGYYKISRVNPVSVGSNGEADFGLWIWGDLSNNVLEYWFSDSESQLKSVEVDTLNFSGWKMKSIKLSNVASGEVKFEGFAINHIEPSVASGTIYIDDAQYDFTTPVDESIELPTKFALSQNYPNPFNPSTIINYSIPIQQNHELSLVTLKVYDILGREVATLVNSQQNAGNYEVSFDASGLTTGIYFYTLKSGDFSQSKKMLLLK